MSSEQSSVDLWQIINEAMASFTEEDVEYIDQLFEKYGSGRKYESEDELWSQLPEVDPDSDDLNDLFAWCDKWVELNGITPELSQKLTEFAKRKVYGPQS